MESSNNIIHPTRLKVLAFGRSRFGRVMMSVRQRRKFSSPQKLGKATYAVHRMWVRRFLFKLNSLG